MLAKYVNTSKRVFISQLLEVVQELRNTKDYSTIIYVKKLLRSKQWPSNGQSKVV